MNIISKTAMFVLLTMVSMASFSAANDLNDLLNQVETSIQSNQKVDQSRLNTFLDDRNAQAQLLKASQRRLATAEENQERLKDLFDQNEARLVEKNELLKSRSGQLGEVFGVVKQQAQDLSGVLQDSLITTEYPNRLSSIEFADEKRIPTLLELQGLWYLMLQEMTATSEVKQFTVPVAQPNGVYVETDVQRVGPFVAIDEQGRFLKYDSLNQQFAVFARQPSSSVQAQAAAFFDGSSNQLMVDPSRGNLLELLGRTPTIQERIDQAGLIGYIIIALGGLGLIVAFWRLLATVFAEIKIKRQFKSIDTLNENNPLGRVLAAVNSSTSANESSSGAGAASKGLSGKDISTKEITSIEIRVDEALLKEVPRLEKGLTFLKLLAAVAPLLGLLGTVTGMIGTFQSITVFGTSDPKLMAGGISQALMTTVLGLCVAIPLLFCHSLMAARVRRLIQLLQQVAFSSIAERIEGSSGTPPSAPLKPRLVKNRERTSTDKALDNAV